MYTICNQFKFQSIVCELETEKPLLTDQPKQPNAFEKLMKNATNRCNVNKIKEPKNAKERLFNDLVTLLISMNVNFT